jgi:hypothetical protein
MQKELFAGPFEDPMEQILDKMSGDLLKRLRRGIAERSRFADAIQKTLFGQNAAQVCNSGVCQHATGGLEMIACDLSRHFALGPKGMHDF